MPPSSSRDGLRKHGIKIGFAVACLLIGATYWMIPYNKVNLPDALYGPGLIAVALAALLLRAFGIAPFWKVVRTMAASVPAAVLLRVAVEVAKDPTSHNLWPFEVVIALALGFACALAGAFAGFLISKLNDSR